MVGPGDNTIANHSLEILLMLLVAFILGWFLCWLYMKRFRLRISELEQTIAGLKKKVKDHENDIENHTITTVKLKGDIAKLETTIGSLENEKVSLSNKILLLQTENERLSTSGTLDIDSEQWETQINELKEKNGNLEATINQLKSEKDTLNDTITQLKAESEVTSAGISDNSDVSRLQHELQQLRTDNEKLQHENDIIRSQLADLETTEVEPWYCK